MSTPSGLEDWTIKAPNRGSHIKGIPHYQPGMPDTGLQIHNLMVLGYYESEVDPLKEGEFVIRGIEDRKISVEKAVDYFIDCVAACKAYLEECERVCRRVKAQLVLSHDDDATAQFNQFMRQNGASDMGEVNVAESDALQSLISPMHDQAMSDRGARRETLQDFAENKLLMCKHSQMYLQVIGEIAPENSKERQPYRTRFYAALVGPNCFSEETKLTWRYILQKVRARNILAQEESNRNNKRQRKNMKNGGREGDDKLAQLMAAESDRDIHSELYVRGMLDWIDVAVGYINKGSQDGDATTGGAAEILRKWESSEALSLLCTRPDMVDHSIGPWSKCIDTRASPFYGIDPIDVFSLHKEINTAPSSDQSRLPPKHPQQFDDRYYLMRVIDADADPNDDSWVVPDTDECIERLTNNYDIVMRDHPEMGHDKGITFEFLPQEVREQCIFIFDLDDLKSVRSVLRKPSIGRWWTKDHIRYQTRLTASEQIGRSACGITSAL